jgi:hypothetical protein
MADHTALPLPTLPAPEEREALANIDRVDLEFAARSFARKRMRQESHPGKGSRMTHWWQLIHARLR